MFCLFSSLIDQPLFIRDQAVSILTPLLCLLTARLFLVIPSAFFVFCSSLTLFQLQDLVRVNLGWKVPLFSVLVVKSLFLGPCPTFLPLAFTAPQQWQCQDKHLGLYVSPQRQGEEVMRGSVCLHTINISSLSLLSSTLCPIGLFETHQYNRRMDETQRMLEREVFGPFKIAASFALSHLNVLDLQK